MFVGFFLLCIFKKYKQILNMQKSEVNYTRNRSFHIFLVKNTNQVQKLSRSFFLSAKIYKNATCCLKHNWIYLHLETKMPP